MRRRDRLRSVAGVLLVAVAIVGLLLWRVVPTAGEEPPRLVAPEPEVAVSIVVPPRSAGRTLLDLPPLPDIPGSRVGVRVATYLKAPSATVTVTALAPDGAPVARCAFPPSAYGDNTLLLCPVARAPAVDAIEVRARDARDAFAVYVRSAGVGGALWGPDPPQDLRGRIDSAVYRLGTRRPAAMATPTLVTAMLLAFGLLLFFLLTLRQVPADRRSGTPR